MPESRRKSRLGAVAARQWGRVTWEQLRLLGVAESTISEWLRQGYLHRRLPRVYAVGHAAPTPEACLAEALLYAGPGAMLSHATAAVWLGLLDGPPSPIHVSTPRQTGSRPGVVVHQRRALDRIWHNGLPTTTLPQLLLDLAATRPLRAVRLALARADYKRILDLPAIESALAPGRTGSGRLREALGEHQPALAHTRSELERRLIEICEHAGLPIPELNARVAGWEVDALWRDIGLALEVDGYDNHRSPAQLRRDRRKEMDLRGAGIRVVRYCAEQVFDRPAEVSADLRRLRRGAS